MRPPKVTPVRVVTGYVILEPGRAGCDAHKDVIVCTAVDTVNVVLDAVNAVHCRECACTSGPSAAMTIASRNSAAAKLAFV